MAQNRLTDFVFLINRQQEIQENLTSYLAKAQALLHVAMDDGFLDYPHAIIHSYLWTLQDIVAQAVNLNEQSVNELLKCMSGYSIYF